MLGDTIVAWASAPGASERAVLRVSGPRARDVAAMVFRPELPAVRATVEGQVSLRGRTLAAMALVMIGPGSFTGEDVVELHVPGSPLLVQVLIEALLADGPARGVRLALPGEFTARAVQNGRLTAAAAEGLLMLLHASDQREAAAGLQWLRGGLAAAVTAVRDELQEALALVEAGLDFTDDETGAVSTATWLPIVTNAGERLRALLATLPAAAPGGEVLLLGRANAGKSSLANALAGRDEALVDQVAGTTRDLLRIEVAPGVALWDAPGDLDQPGPADAAALALRDRLAGRAHSLLVVIDASEPFVPPSALVSPSPWLGVVWTKCDRVPAPPPLPAAAAERAGSVPVFATSAHIGAGLESLRAWLLRAARAGVVDAGAPLRHALTAARDATARATAVAHAGAEVAAVELQAALRALDGIAGSHSPEHLLDRIYGRFCLGK